mgnify:CR=1 FL=1
MSHFNPKTHRKFTIRAMKRSLETIEYQKNTEALAKFAKALGHPTRIAILKHLKNQSCYFTGDLVNAGLIQGELKSPKIKYCINHDNWKIAKALFQDFFD